MQALRGLGSRLVEVAHRIMARSGGVRVRSALAAACIVAVALTVAGVALLLFLQHSFAAGVDANTRQEAGQIVNSLREPGGDSADLAQLPGASNALVQVLDQGGAVMESSPNLAGSPALSSLRPPPGHTATATVQRGQDDDQLYVVAEGVATDQGPRTVLAATSLDAVE